MFAVDIVDIVWQQMSRQWSRNMRMFCVIIICCSQDGSETWPVRKKNVVALQQAEMSMVRWMCGVKLKDRLSTKELRERLGIDDIALVLPQNRLRWYGHVLRKDDDWVKECIEYAVEGPRPRGRRKRTWRKVVQEDCQARKLNKEMPWIVANGGR